MKRLLILLAWIGFDAHADCRAFLTRNELLKVDSRVVQEIRRLSRDQLYVRLMWYDTMPRQETSYAMDITNLLREQGNTPPTHPAIPLIPPPPNGQAFVLRSMVRTPGRLVPAIVNAQLGQLDGVYHLRVTVRPANRVGEEADHVRAEEAIAVYTLLAAAPYVSRLSFRMDLNVIKDEKYVIDLQRELRNNAVATDAVLPIMDVAADVVLARPSFVTGENFRLSGYRENEEVELDIAHDFRALYELTLDDAVVERLSNEGQTLN